MAVKSIRDIDLKGKRVFIRVDFNVPLSDGGSVMDDTRIRRALPTLNLAVEQGAKCIVASHLGRPKGQRKPEMSLKPVAARLEELIGREVKFVSDCIGPEAESAASELDDGEILVLENLRFHQGETKNDPEFAKALAKLADVYVNDAFGTAHRAHASTVGVPDILKERAAGLLMKEELDSLSKAFENPAKPVVAIFGGAKVSDKAGVLKNILDRMDAVLIGGGMANTFLAGKGFNMGASKVEEDMGQVVKETLDAAEKRGTRFLLPMDVVVAKEMAPTASTRTTAMDLVEEDEMALDIGPKTTHEFKKEIAAAGTIVWNGPMGVFEMEPFKMGTLMIARAIGAASGFSLIGGGDTVRAVDQFGVEKRVSYISTGGGAFMEFLEGKTLPGVAALEQ